MKKNNSNSIISILLIALSLVACKEQGLTLYDGDKSGNNIYFAEKLAKSDNYKWMRPISFMLAPSGTTDSLIRIPIQVTGAKSQQGRAYAIHVSDTSSMIEGTHFDFISEHIIKSNKLTDTLLIKLYKTADLSEKRVYLNLELIENDNFKTELSVQKNSGITQNLLNYAIYTDNIIPVSYLWTSSDRLRDYVTGRFGSYSRKKVELMIEVLGVDPKFFYDVESALSDGVIQGWASYMKYWLTKEKNEGRIYYDENNNEIKMGSNA